MVVLSTRAVQWACDANPVPAGAPCVGGHVRLSIKRYRHRSKRICRQSRTGSADEREHRSASPYRRRVDGNEEIDLLLPGGRTERAGLRWSWSGDCAVVELDISTFGTVSASGHDLSAALAGVRAVIEPEGARVLCNGSRRDATVSGMLSQSTGAARVYLLDGVPRGQRPATVGIFDPAEAAMVGTLSEQDEYRRGYFGD